MWLDVLLTNSLVKEFDANSFKDGLNLIVRHLNGNYCDGMA